MTGATDTARIEGCACRPRAAPHPRRAGRDRPRRPRTGAETALLPALHLRRRAPQRLRLHAPDTALLRANGLAGRIDLRADGSHDPARAALRAEVPPTGPILDRPGAEAALRSVAPARVWSPTPRRLRTRQGRRADGPEAALDPAAIPERVQATHRPR